MVAMWLELQVHAKEQGTWKCMKMSLKKMNSLHVVAQFEVDGEAILELLKKMKGTTILVALHLEGHGIHQIVDLKAILLPTVDLIHMVTEAMETNRLWVVEGFKAMWKPMEDQKEATMTVLV